MFLYVLMFRNICPMFFFVAARVNTMTVSRRNDVFVVSFCFVLGGPGVVLIRSPDGGYVTQ